MRLPPQAYLEWHQRNHPIYDEADYMCEFPLHCHFHTGWEICTSGVFLSCPIKRIFHICRPRFIHPTTNLSLLNTMGSLDCDTSLSIDRDRPFVQSSIRVGRVIFRNGELRYLFMLVFLVKWNIVIDLSSSSSQSLIFATSTPFHNLRLRFYPHKYGLWNYFRP